VLGTSRAEHAFLRDCASPVYPTKDTVVWWNYAGGAANLLFARLLEESLGSRITADNFKLTFREGAGNNASVVIDAVAALRAQETPTQADAARLFKAGPAAGLSKFAPCLPESLQQELGARDAFDVGGGHARRPALR